MRFADPISCITACAGNALEQYHRLEVNELDSHLEGTSTQMLLARSAVLVALNRCTLARIILASTRTSLCLRKYAILPKYRSRAEPQRRPDWKHALARPQYLIY